MMMPPPQVVGVLLKKPGQQTHPRLPPLDPQETKIKGEFIIPEIFLLIIYLLSPKMHTTKITSKFIILEILF